MPTITFTTQDSVANGTVVTRRGRRKFNARVKEGGSPADMAGSTVRGMKALSKDSRDQQDQANDRIKGSKDQRPRTKANDKATRKELAKKGGLIMTWSFYTDPGYVKPDVTQSDSAVLRSINFQDTYRSDVRRALEDKDRYPIANIQVLSRRRGGSFGRRGYKTIVPPFTKFFLESVQFSSAEKYQLALTFRSFRLFTFDAQPEIWTFSGRLLNTENQNWTAEFRALYNNYLRATQCAKNNAQCFLSFQDFSVAGVMLNTGSTLMANKDNEVPFSFSLLVFNEASISSNPLVQVSQRLIYPRAAKNNPALLFEIMRNSYARQYGQKERRGGAYVLRQYQLDKMGRISKKLKDLDERRIRSNPGR